MYCVHDFDLIGGGGGGGCGGGRGRGPVLKHPTENSRICLDCLFDIPDSTL